MPREIEVKSILNKKKQRDSWFLDESGSEMPEFYEEAFYNKMNELGKEYNLPFMIVL